MKSANDIDEEINAIIARVGWAVQGVFPCEEDDGPTFCYTAGLAGKKLPELIVFGLPINIGQQFLNIVARKLLDGETLPLDADIDDLAEGFATRLIAAPRSATDKYMFATETRYPGYTALQLVWPDRKGRWPWDDAFEPHLKPLQPILRANLH